MGLFGDKKVEDVMTERPRALRPETTVMEAARAMETEDVGALPVVEDGGRLAGIVTDRDLALRVLGDDLDHSTSVARVVSTELVTVSGSDSLEHAMQLMADHQIRRLPVVGDEDRLIGMVAVADISAAAGERETGDVVQAISEGSPQPRL